MPGKLSCHHSWVSEVRLGFHSPWSHIPLWRYEEFYRFSAGRNADPHAVFQTTAAVRDSQGQFLRRHSGIAGVNELLCCPLC